MTSRTPEGKHTKRFIIEVKIPSLGNKFTRSSNFGHTGFFETREAAQSALTPESTADGFTYRVRQK